MKSNRKNYTYQQNQSQSNLIDNFQRKITYLRLSVTDRCNLRCRYCMPAEGIPLQPRQQILSWEEMLRVITLFSDLGITKLRITGGEPFLRKGIMDFLRKVAEQPDSPDIYVTSNGICTARYVDELEKLGVAGVNLSLDTLNPQRFHEITRRDSFAVVMESLQTMLESSIPLKINMVVKQDFNTDEIIPMAQLAQHHAIEVRFIEEMPFNGSTTFSSEWTGEKIIGELNRYSPGISALPLNHSTAQLYRIPEFKGIIGIICGYSRTFCAGCNRIRVTADGKLKTCLYDTGVLDLRHLLRNGTSDPDIQTAILQCVQNRFRDGHAAHSANSSQSMISIGG